MLKMFRIGSAAVSMIVLLSAAAFAQPGQKREILLDNGKPVTVSNEDLSGQIGDVYGKKLYFGGMSDQNYRIFRKDGTGEFVNDCKPGQNAGTFTWGFAPSDPAKPDSVIKTYKEWHWGVPTDNKAAFILIRFKGGCQDNQVTGGIIGVNNGKVVQGMGYGYSEK